MFHKPIPNSNVEPVAPYSNRAPSPPFLHISTTARGEQPENLYMMPSYENLDTSQLSAEDVRVITQDKTQIACARARDWTYEQRRTAQAITDFLYLGPFSVVRDHDFLREEGITMVLVCRDSRMVSPRLQSVDRACNALGIEAKYLDLDGIEKLISGFSEGLRIINEHLLDVYHSQARAKNDQGQIAIEASDFRRGKVLVTCETGNDRSASIAIAYVMAVFGRSMRSVTQFVSVKRFCCSLDEELKRKLLCWEDILKARSQVAQSKSEAAAFVALPPPGAPPAKRRFGETMDVDTDQDMSNGMDTSDADLERFMGRDAFVPFRDSMEA